MSCLKNITSPAYLSLKKIINLFILFISHERLKYNKFWSELFFFYTNYWVHWLCIVCETLHFDFLHNYFATPFFYFHPSVIWLYSRTCLLSATLLSRLSIFFFHWSIWKEKNIHGDNVTKLFLSFIFAFLLPYGSYRLR